MRFLPRAAALAVLPLAAAAEGEPLPGGCTLLDASPIVAVLVCPPDVAHEALAEAGRAACAARLPCGAWVWSDATRAPSTAPANHDGLTRDQVTAARGVWIAGSASFLSIEQLPK